jgi:5-formyltetrahydrofolate cyclo-ligase
MIGSKKYVRDLLSKRRDVRNREIGEYRDLVFLNVLNCFVEVLKGRKVVAGYFNVGSEFDCVTILKYLNSKGFTVCLPVTDSTRILKFRVWDCLESSLSPGKFKIPVPSIESPEIIPESMIVPMLGFNSDLHRIGYGGGYYDSTKNAYPSIQAIGLSFLSQFYPDLPVEPHDQRLDYIITEAGQFFL